MWRVNGGKQTKLTTLLCTASIEDTPLRLPSPQALYRGRQDQCRPPTPVLMLPMCRKGSSVTNPNHQSKTVHVSRRSPTLQEGHCQQPNCKAPVLFIANSIAMCLFYMSEANPRSSQSNPLSRSFGGPVIPVLHIPPCRQRLPLAALPA